MQGRPWLGLALHGDARERRLWAPDNVRGRELNGPQKGRLRECARHPRAHLRVVVAGVLGTLGHHLRFEGAERATGQGRELRFRASGTINGPGGGGAAGPGRARALLLQAP